VFLADITFRLDITIFAFFKGVTCFGLGNSTFRNLEEHQLRSLPERDECSNSLTKALLMAEKMSFDGWVHDKT
jgi:hypothetical protein